LFIASRVIFALVGASLAVTGTVYLSVDQFMPYHAAALEADWSELDANNRGLILGFLKGLGSGAFIAGLAVLYMVGASVKSDLRPFLILLPLIAVGYSALLCYATYTVYANTPGQPPLLLNLLLVAAGILASTLLALAERSKRKQ